jgi:phosphate transport system permease protein
VDVLGGFQFVGHPPFVTNPALFEASAALPTQVWAVISAGVSGRPRWVGGRHWSCSWSY